MPLGGLSEFDTFELNFCSSYHSFCMFITFTLAA